MLGTPVDPSLLATKSVAVTMRTVREISRKGSVMLDPKQVPNDIGHYLAGFADGEGSFNVSFRPRSDYRMPWKVSLCFNISQRDEAILAKYKRYLECGTMRNETRRGLVLRGEQPPSNPRERHSVLRSLRFPFRQETTRLREVQEARSALVGK